MLQPWKSESDCIGGMPTSIMIPKRIPNVVDGTSRVVLLYMDWGCLFECLNIAASKYGYKDNSRT
jgi:hypothetical protein